MALPREAWMNIMMDEKAKKKVSLDKLPDQQYSIPYEGWICLLEGTRITKNLTNTLRTHLNGPILLNHWATSQRYKPGAEKMIDWEMADKAINNLPKAQQKWVSKLAAKFLPYGKNMQRWNLRTQAKCPRCACPIEDKDHIMRCPAESAVARWNKALIELDNWMQAARTHPQLRQDIIAGLQQWHEDGSNAVAPSEEISARTAQDSIGWGIALEGCISTRWREEQDQYLKVFKSRKSSKRWTTALIKRLMTTAWDMWHHRNEALHNSEVNQQEILEADINQEIKQAYDQSMESIPKAAKKLLRRPLKKLLQLPRYYKKQWIATLRAVQTGFQSQQEGLSRDKHQPKNKYLTRITTGL